MNKYLLTTILALASILTGCGDATPSQPPKPAPTYKVSCSIDEQKFVAQNATVTVINLSGSNYYQVTENGKITSVPTERCFLERR